MMHRARLLSLTLLLSPACDSKSEPVDSKPETADANGDETPSEAAKPEPVQDGAEPKAEADAAEPTEPEAGESDKPATNTKAIDVAPAEPPEVTLLEAGKDAQVLRLEPVAGTTESMTMTMHMSMTMAGNPMGEMKMPAMVTSMSSTIGEVTDDRIEATMNFDSIEIEPDSDGNPALAAELSKMLAGFEEFSASVEIDRRGAMLGGTVNMPQGLPPQLQDTMNQMQQSIGKIQVPLPEEAVGVGGKWTAVSVIEQNGMKLKQTATYEMKEREGNTVSLDVGIEQDVVNETFSPQPGVTATIDSYEGGGEGTLKLQLDKLTPTQSDTTIAISMKMKVAAGGQEQTQDISTKVRMVMERTK